MNETTVVANIIDGNTVVANVTNSQTVSASVSSGAKGDAGPPGPAGTGGGGGGSTGTVTNVSSLNTDLTVATQSTTPVLTIVSAPKLTTARTINSVAFDGTAAITIADATKEPIITAGTTAQYYRGDKSFQPLTQDVVPNGVTNKAYTATEQTKLAGVATGATANSTDAILLARGNHTGTQVATTISDFQATVSANTAVTANTNKVSNATHTGDATGATTLTVGGINGTQLSTLATGILKNTTTTGVPSIAVAADFPVLNQSTTGNASTATLATSSNALASATTTIAVNASAAPTSGQVLTASSGTAAAWVTPAGGGGGGTTAMQDEGVALTQRATLNFIGAGVTAVDNPTSLRTDVTIPADAVSSVNTRTGAVTGLAEDTAVVHLAGPETITGDKTFTGTVKNQRAYPIIEQVNTAVEQYAGAGVRLYSTVATLTGAAGAEFYSGISDTGATTTYFGIQAVNRTGAFLYTILNINLATKAATFDGDVIIKAGKSFSAGNASGNSDFFLYNGGATGASIMQTDAPVNFTSTLAVTGLITGTNTATNALKSATTTVSVSAATAPTAGQVLTASGGTAAAWATPAGGGSGITRSINNTTATAYTIGSSLTVDYVYFITGAHNSTMVAASSNTNVYKFINLHTAPVQLVRAGTDTFFTDVGGIVTLDIASGESVELISNGTSVWKVT